MDGKGLLAMLLGSIRNGVGEYGSSPRDSVGKTTYRELGKHIHNLKIFSHVPLNFLCLSLLLQRIRTH